jgi:hypothetical protein
MSVLLAFVVALFSCGSRTSKTTGNKTQSLSVGSFSGVDVGGSIDVNVVVKQGTQSTATLIGEEEDITNTEYKVQNGVLVIGPKKWYKHKMRGDKLQLNITVPELNRVDLSGACNADVKGAATSEKFIVNLSGACNVTIAELFVQALSVDISGAGSFTANRGKVDQAKYNISGAGSVSAAEVVTQKASSDISGTGSAELNVSDNLEASISGAGKIRYKGRPTVKQQVSGVGSVRPLD